MRFLTWTRGQVQVRAVPRAGRGAAARGARAGGGAGSARSACRTPPHGAVAGAGGRVLRGRRVPVAARRAPHEAAGGRARHHAHAPQATLQERQHRQGRR